LFFPAIGTCTTATLLQHKFSILYHIGHNLKRDVVRVTVRAVLMYVVCTYVHTHVAS
jgi:hypothetical protein